jgi:hypothetical protein
MNSPLAFEDVAQALAALGSSVQAAEAHGCLCGALCACRSYPPAEWLEELLPDPDTEAAAGTLEGPLGALYVGTRAVLAERDMEFVPLLPDDEEPLPQRVEALATWCSGFLYGFGASGAAPASSLEGEVGEVLADLAEISRVGAVGSAAGEVEEEAYAELVEFLRVGVQLVYDQLEAARAAQPSAEPRH